MRAPVKKATPLWTSDDGLVTKPRTVHPAPPPGITKPRPRLTPEQRGRFWQSVGAAIEAAQATHPRGYEQGEVSHG